MATKWLTLLVAVVMAGCGTNDTSETMVPSPATSTTSSSPTVPTTTSILTTTITTITTITTTTTTVAPEPPILEITDPLPGAVATTEVYTFRGVTDPGCTVDVGDRYFADVNANGAWTLDLMLRPGGNTTTITATNRDGLETARRVSLTYNPMALRPDGLGIAHFGDRVDEALTALTAVLGQPTDVVDDPEAMNAVSGGQYGFGPDMTATVAVWDDLGLLVAFSEYPFYRQDGSMHFSGWTAVAPGIASRALGTEEDIGIGSTFVEVQATYGDRFHWGYGEEVCGPWASLRFPNEEECCDRISLWFRKLTDQPETELVGLTAGASPGC